MSAILSCANNVHAVHPLLCLHEGDDPQRSELEGFVHERYRASYQANISHFLPFLLATWQDQELKGVLGLRPGASGRFFVENYLDTAIENIVAQRQGGLVGRDSIIETGNLAANRGCSQLLFIVLTQILHQADYRWITFTATAQVIMLLHRLGFEPQTICEANVERLGTQARDWGRYYDNHPSVVIGSIESAHRVLQSNELAQKLLRDHVREIQEIAEVLQAAKGRDLYE